MFLWRVRGAVGVLQFILRGPPGGGASMILLPANSCRHVLKLVKKLGNMKFFNKKIERMRIGECRVKGNVCDRKKLENNSDLTL